MNRKQRRAAASSAPDEGRGSRLPEATSAQGHNDLGCQLLLRGRLEEAAAHFARALTLMPELLEQYAPVVATLFKVNPAIRAGVERVAGAWPRELPADEILGPNGIARIAR